METIGLRSLIPVDDGGYHFKRGKLVGISGEESHYDAFETEPELFIRFAQMNEVTEPRVIDFANSYGPVCETVSDWKHYQFTFDYLIRFWQAYETDEKGWRVSVREGWKVLEERDQASDARTLKDKADYLLQFHASRSLAAISTVQLEDDAVVLLSSPLDVMYVQFARAISAKKILRFCTWCNGPFLITPPLSRNNKQFCKRSCAVMASRKRRSSK